ncbi:MAG: hypothetical protein PHN49_03760 [Candidatus Omnitrophica bacterium]|nr:hypothetical protein [Candidatus Omnitrophota bacterium]MDD5670735.1 hypothetical protein [Candidatus Omnitrophota bacterium]
MIKRISYCVAVLSMLLGSLCFAEDAPQMSPEQFYLNQESSAKFASLRRAAKSSFQGILLYPDDIRNSVLEISQYPDLIVLLKNKKYLNEPEFEKLVQEKPAEVKDAIDKLKAYPEIIDILSENMVITALMGEMVKEKKDTTLQVVKRLSDSVQQGHTKAVDAWTKQMQQNPQAVKDLQAAAEAYAKQNNLPSPNQPVTAAQATANPNPYGYYVNDQKTVVIQDMPSNAMMQYALLNKTMYMMLFATAVNNHSMFYDDYYWRYHDDEWEDNWNEYQDSLNGISSELGALNTNIDEIQENRKEAKENRQDKKDEWQDRKDQAKDKIQDRRDSADAKPTGDRLPQKGEFDHLPVQRGLPMPQQISAPGVLGQRANVSFQPFSRQQQINRASQFHAGSWRQDAGSRNLESRGGAAPSRDFSGAARSGGGHRR